MCEACQPFCETVSGDLEKLHNRVYFEGVRPGILRIVVGSLQWDDVMDCLLECTTCKRRFDFRACKGKATFGPVKPPDAV